MDSSLSENTIQGIMGRQDQTHTQYNTSYIKQKKTLFYL